MTDYRVPLTFGDVQDQTYDGATTQLANRFKAILGTNPYMADTPDAILAMAQSDTPLEQVVGQSGQMWGMMQGDALMTRLQSMSGQQQRGLWQTLGVGQQQALAQMGYEPPQTEQESWLSSVVEPVAGALGNTIGAISTVVSPVLSPALHGLTWLGDQPAHLYRTLRLMDDDAQWAGLIGAAIGVAGVALAPFTGGGSLAAAGLLIAGGLAGATAGAALTPGITNPGDWWRAFQDSADGERTFDRPSKQKATEMLGDPRLTGLARDIADLDGLDLDELAEEIAGMREGGEGAQLHRLEEIATDRLGLAPGSSAFQQAYQSMLNVMKEPLFQDAVRTLQHGKISIGRDFADQIGLDPDSGLHSFISGVTDAAWLVAADPTLFAFQAVGWNRARKAGMELADGALAAERFVDISNNVRSVNRLHTLVAEAVNTNDWTMLRRLAPGFTSAQADLNAYKHVLIDTGKIAEGGFGLSQFQDYFVGASHLEPLMRGVGAVKAADGVVLEGLTAFGKARRELLGGLRAFTGGMNDVRLENAAFEVLRNNPGRESVARAFNPAIFGDLTDEGVLRTLPYANTANPIATGAGRALGHVPGVRRLGGLFESMTTMAGKSKAIHLYGDEAFADIHAFAELGRYTGMPSWARTAYRDAILSSADPGARFNAVHGMLDDMLTVAGARGTTQDSEIVDTFLSKMKQAYHTDETVRIGNQEAVGGILRDEMARAVLMPDLKELRRAAATGNLAKHILGVAEHPIVETALNKIWKPAILLRIGFIPRAAGEEVLNYMARAGWGSLGQEFAATSIAKSRVYQEAIKARAAGTALTEAENIALNVRKLGQVPAHMRPLARMMARWEWTRPGVRGIERYGSWLRAEMEHGVTSGEGVDRLLAGIGGQALDAERAGLGALQRGRLNVADKVNSIVLGNPHSWRRMLAGGVDDALLDSMVNFERQFGRQIMRETGATSHGPYQPNHRKTEEDFVVTARSHRRHVSQEDVEFYQKGFHEETQRVVADTHLGQVLSDFAPRLTAGTTVDPAEVDRIVDLWRTTTDDVAHQLGIEFISGAPSPETTRAALDRIATIDPDTARVLSYRTPRMKPASYAEMTDALDSHISALEGELGTLAPRARTAAERRLEKLRRVQDDMHRQSEVVDALDTLTPNDRAYVASVLRSQGAPGARSTAWGTADEPLAPAISDVPMPFENVTSFHQLPLDNFPGRNFHGSAAPLDEIAGEGGHTATNLFGPGLYTTDSPASAGSYAKRFGGDTPTLQETKWVGEHPPKLLDASAANPDAHAAAEAALARIETEIPALSERAAKLRAKLADPDASGFDVLAEVHHVLTPRLVSRSGRTVVAPLEGFEDASDSIMRTMNESLRTAGYDGIRYPSEGNHNLDTFDNVSTVWFDPKQLQVIGRQTEGAGRIATAPPAATGSRVRSTGLTSENLPDHLAHTPGTPVRSGTFDSLHGEMHAQLKSSWLNARSQQDSMWSASFGHGEQGLKQGQVMLFEAELPMFGGRYVDVDDIIKLAPNPAVAARHRDTIEQIINNQRAMNVTGTHTVLVADQELARELAAVRARIYQRAVPETPPRVAMFDRRMLSGDGEFVSEIATRNAGSDFIPTAWAAQKDAIVNRIGPMPASIDEIADDYATTALSQLRQQVTRRHYNELRARTRPVDALPDGTVPPDEPLVYRYNGPDGVADPVPADEALVGGHTFYTKDGKQIDTGDARYFTRTGSQVDEQGEILWPLVGPMIEDRLDEIQGTVRFAARNPSVRLNPTVETYNDDTAVRWYRSRAKHVGNVPLEDLPEFTTATMTTTRRESAWQRLVRRGFDNVIGPSIDAIVRLPMARHYFHARYQFAKSISSFLRDEGLAADVGSIVTRLTGATDNVDEWARFAREAATFDGDERAAGWTGHQAISWLNGHSDDDVAFLAESMIERGKSETLGRWASANIGTRARLHPDTNADQLLAYMRGKFGDLDNGIDGASILRAPRELQSERVRRIVADDPVLSQLMPEDWAAASRFQKNLDHIDKAAGEHAAQFAINDMLPYIDSHEVKTQFAEGGKQFLPFWYAEENFMRRWALTVTHNPETVRKVQLGYAGLKTGGIIRTDQSGRDWFVYPGSTALIDAVGKVPGLGDVLPVGMGFQTPTDAILPGMNSRFGTPAFSPLVTIPLDIASVWAPELEPLETAIVGDYVASRPAIMQLFPTSLVQIADAVLSSDGNTRYNSAMLSAIAQLDANGNGLSDNPTPDEQDTYLRNLHGHARIVTVAQAMMGFFAPGPSTQVQGGSTANASGLGFQIDAETFSDEYRTLIRNLGIEQGTIEYLALHPDAGPHDIVNPLAYTVARSESVSGAPLPYTSAAAQFYTQHESTFTSSPLAAPWLLPQPTGDTRTQYAADTQAIQELRRGRTPAEFLRAIKYKEAAGQYFESRKDYLNQVAAAREVGATDAVTQLNAQWQVWAAGYKAQHPIFREQLESGEGHERRLQTITQMRTMLADPATPDAGNLAALRQAMSIYDEFSMRLADMQSDRTARGTSAREELKGRYESIMDSMVEQMPSLSVFWSSVLRPESGLD